MDSIYKECVNCQQTVGCWQGVMSCNVHNLCFECGYCENIQCWICPKLENKLNNKIEKNNKDTQK